MTSRGFRRGVRVALWIAGAFLVVVLVVAFIKLVQEAPSNAAAQRLNAIQAVSGVLSAAAAIAAVLLGVWRDPPPSPPRARLGELLGPKLLGEDKLINRASEMHRLVEVVEASPVAGCHGPRGAGKSFLLEHVADVVNKHRHATPGQKKPSRLSAALYFDLAAAAGFKEAEAQICHATLGDTEATWADFVSLINRSFKRKSVMLILDNVNSPGLWQEIGAAAYQYRLGRPTDKLVFGSIEPITLSNLTVAHVPVFGLDIAATKDLLAVRGVSMNCSDLAKLHDDCNGLPLYLRLLTAYGNDVRLGRGAAVIVEQMILQLPSEVRRLLSYASLLALTSRRIALSALRRCPLAHLEDQLMIAEAQTLMMPVPKDGDRRLKLHDIIRDTALRILDSEVSEAALFMFERAHERQEFEHAALYAMFADPDAIGAIRFEELLERVVRAAVKVRNYALLGNLYVRAHEHTRILTFVSSDQNRCDVLCYGRASELAGLGHYAQAEDELNSSSITRTRWDPHVRGTDLQAELRFLQADIAHLLNRYDEAAQMFEDLDNWAAATGRPGLRARCVWGHAHVLRHQGRDLETALALFAEAARLADDTDELFPKAYSITGASGIKVLAGVVPDDEEQLLADVEHEVAADSAHDGYMLEVWKTQAQLAWLRGNRQVAIDLVDAATERALARNDRLLYNLYFERAEYYRFDGAHAAALENYRRVLEFGNGNGDRNLISNALLGVVLVELSAGRWLFHETRDKARASVLSARQTAIEADIRITGGLAEAVSSMLDDSVPTPDSIRLIVL